jgi:hypothetical protein
MMMEVKFPAAAALELREVKPGMWNAVKSDEGQVFGLADVSSAFQQSSDAANTASTVPAEASPAR